MKIIEKIGLALLAIGLLWVIVPSLEAKDIEVKCDKGQLVQKELDNLNGPATIVVTGVCNENLVVKQDDVTLQGGTFLGPDPNQNTILVQGARRVLITGATVGGARNGIAVYQGGTLTVENSSIQGNARVGIVVIFGSSAAVNSCTVQNNAYEGLIATDNSALVLVNSTISYNGRTGVSVSRGSSARIGQDVLGGAGPNTIQNNGSGISVYQTSQATIVNNIIQNNTRDGVLVEGASARLTNNNITSNWKGIEVSSAGNARIGINDDGSPGLGNTIESNELEGISVGNGGAAYILNNQIRLNGLATGRAGVGIYRATGRLVGGNTIEGNGGHGVEVNQGTFFQGKGDWNFIPAQDLIRQNGRSGISAWNGASLDIQHAEVTNNTENGIALSLRSTLRIFGSTVSSNAYNGIGVFEGSAAAFYHPPDTEAATITANGGWGVLCGGDESSCTGDIAGVIGNTGGEVSCTGF